MARQGGNAAKQSKTARRRQARARQERITQAKAYDQRRDGKQ